MRSRRVSAANLPRLDVALAAAAAIALIVEGSVRAKGGLAVGAYLLAPVAAAGLAWRRQAPLAALIAVEVAAFTWVLATGVTWVATAMVLIELYTVALYGQRNRSMVVAALTAVAVALTIVLHEGSFDLGGAATRIPMVFAAVAIGDTRRGRRALAAAAAERAARLERDREEESSRRVQAARLSIARDVHDTVAHALVEINVHAGVTAHVKGQDPAMALAYIKRTSAEALNDLRTTLNVLRDTDEIAPTAPAPSLDAVPDLVGRAREAGLDAEADIRVDGAAVPSAVGQVGFRIVQEALTNVLRHADARSTQVRIRVDHGDLDIAVRDDGRGGAASGGGHGLDGMGERIAALGGKFDAGPAQGGGWRIHARLPLSVGKT
jgi:signal transduction histidine kinase